MGSLAKDSLTQDARLQFTPAVFENPLLAMVTMVTLQLALSPLLALPVQTTSLTSSPNSPNFDNGDHVLTTHRRAKRSIIPLIKGAADYWLRSGLDSTSFFLLCKLLSFQTS